MLELPWLTGPRDLGIELQEGGLGRAVGLRGQPSDDALARDASLLLEGWIDLQDAIIQCTAVGRVDHLMQRHALGRGREGRAKLRLGHLG